MTGILALMLALGLADRAAALDAAEAELSVDIGVHELKAHVFRLTSPEFLAAADQALRGRHAISRLPSSGWGWSRRLPAPIFRRFRGIWPMTRTE